MGGGDLGSPCCGRPPNVGKLGKISAKEVITLTSRHPFFAAAVGIVFFFTVWNVCSRKGWKQLAGNNGRITGGGVSLLFRKVIVKKKFGFYYFTWEGGGCNLGELKVATVCCWGPWACVTADFFI